MKARMREDAYDCYVLEICAFPVADDILLASCGDRGTEKPVEAVALTEVEIAQVNKAFASTRKENGRVNATEVSCFFTYTFTSDFGPGSFTCTGGEVKGDTVRLWSEASGEGGRNLLTLEREDGNWYIRSFQKVQTGAEQ